MNEQFNFNNSITTEDTQPSKGKAVLSLIMGILSIYFGTIPGIIMAIIGKRSAVDYLSAAPNGSAAGLAKVGKILCSIGLPVSIASLVLVAILWGIVILEYILLFFLSYAPYMF